MTPEPPSPTPQDAGATNAWVRPVAVILSCLVLGFIGGWVLRGDEGEVTVLAPTADGGVPAGTTPDVGAGTGTGGTAPAGTAPAETGGTAPGGTTGTVPGATAGTVAEPPAPGRADVRLAVLNGTSAAGLAASTAERAETLGYRDVATGNAPATSGPSVVYYRGAARAAAERAATDLEIVSVRLLPRGGAVAEAAPGDAQVVVVLGPG